MSFITALPRLVGADVRTHPARAVSRFLPHFAVGILFVIGVFFAHESGHALTATFFGARVVMFNVLGMQWFPTLEWTPELGFGGYVSWWVPPARDTHWLIVMAGSNLTMLLAFLAVLALNLFQPRGLARTALAVVSLYFLDSLIHVLPVLGLWRLGWNFRFARTFSEAHTAAVNLGIPSEVYVAAVFIASALILGLLLRGLRSRSQKPEFALPPD